MKTKDKLIKDSIMSTDVYIGLSSNKYDSEVMLKDIDLILNEIREFEYKYSRFIKDNTLWRFNHASEIQVDNEFIDILKQCLKYYKETGGIFDPTVLNSLVNEGYSIGKQHGYKGKSIYETNKTVDYNFSNLDVDFNTNIVKKSDDLYVDLGGIGKGYIVDKIKDKISKKYSNSCISLGGDMYAAGKDEKNEYDYWAIEIEGPKQKENNDLPTLILNDKAVATSGTYKRKWDLNGETKTHIIDTKTNKAVKSDLQSVTVVGDSAVYCDVYSKYLLIIGLEKSRKTCNDNEIAAVFIDSKDNYEITNEMENYVWKNV